MVLPIPTASLFLFAIVCFAIISITSGASGSINDDPLFLSSTSYSSNPSSAPASLSSSLASSSSTADQLSRLFRVAIQLKLRQLSALQNEITLDKKIYNILNNAANSSTKRQSQIDADLERLLKSDQSNTNGDLEPIL